VEEGIDGTKIVMAYLLASFALGSFRLWMVLSSLNLLT
jgi:hypothetical protein